MGSGLDMVRDFGEPIPANVGAGAFDGVGLIPYGHQIALVDGHAQFIPPRLVFGDKQVEEFAKQVAGCSLRDGDQLVDLLALQYRKLSGIIHVVFAS